MQKILNKYPSIALYTNPKILAILFLGLSSGLPLPLTGATLDAVLNEAGVTKTAIGLFAIVGTPYSLKFLWAPLIDNLSIPIFTKLLGRRRSWMILTQIGLIISISQLGMSNPAENITLTIFWAFIVAFFSASQDIVIDAYRIESLEEKEQGAGASTSTFGYITAMKLLGGALAFWMSDHISWEYVYFIMAAIILVGIITVMIAGEPKSVKIIEKKSWLEWLHDAVISPFSDFMKHSKWWAILLFIILYKLGDAFAGKMTTPFLQDIGFSNSEIAFYLKTFGLGALLLGTFFGGIIVYRFGMLKSLWICGILQMISNLMFVLQAYIGYDTELLSITIGVENLSAGMGTAAFVAFLSSLCNISYTATQYALLTSFAATGRTWLSASSGWFVDQLGWESFFILSTIIAIPGVLLIKYMQSFYKISK
ncbi:AmpG family muropeptide MFS transporter [Rickettsiales bacterium]|nr:AmpG family muropeptide MFS transporter [Rickettsiales bacterium]